MRFTSGFVPATLAPVLALALAGCATVTDGSKQIVTITTDPSGAACVVDQLGAAPGDHVDEAASTPATVLINKSDRQLKITCAKSGYPTTTALQGVGLNYYTLGNVLNGVVIGTAVDIGSGAFFRYPSTVHIKLAVPPPPPPSGTAPSRTGPGMKAGSGNSGPTSLAPTPSAH